MKKTVKDAEAKIKKARGPTSHQSVRGPPSPSHAASRSWTVHGESSVSPAVTTQRALQMRAEQPQSKALLLSMLNSCLGD